MFLENRYAYRVRFRYTEQDNGNLRGKNSAKALLKRKPRQSVQRGSETTRRAPLGRLPTANHTLKSTLDSQSSSNNIANVVASKR